MRLRTILITAHLKDGNGETPPKEMLELALDFSKQEPTKAMYSGELMTDHMILHNSIMVKYDALGESLGDRTVKEELHRVAHQVNESGDWIPDSKAAGLIYEVMIGEESQGFLFARFEE